MTPPDQAQLSSNLATWWDHLSQTQNADLSNKSVLVVDDEAALRDVIVLAIQAGVGCKTETATSGEEALEIIRKKAPDVVFSDMMMPGIHGLELICAIKKIAPGTDIIVVTGYSEAFPYVDVIDAGACDVIPKPCSTWEIEGKLLRVFRERLTRDQFLLAEEKYRSLFELSIGSNILLDAISLEVLDVNQSFLEFMETDRESVLGVDFMKLVHEREHDRMKMLFDILAKRGRGTVGDVSFSDAEHGERSADASLTYITLPGTTFILMNLVDITERRNIEKQLATAATTDQLTKLLNRRAFDTRLQGATIRSRRTEEPLCLALIDLDNFKACNDTHGHQTGDEVLILLADVVRKSIRGGHGDQAFRLGGDEFAIVLSGATAEVAATVAERMRSLYEEAPTFGTTLSIGIAQLTGNMNAENLVKSADNALYQAKGQGKNAVCVA